MDNTDRVARFFDPVFLIKKRWLICFFLVILYKYINFNTKVSFISSINTINNSIDYVYYIKYTMDNMKNILI